MFSASFDSHQSWAQSIQYKNYELLWGMEKNVIKWWQLLTLCTEIRTRRMRIHLQWENSKTIFICVKMVQHCNIFTRSSAPIPFSGCFSEVEGSFLEEKGWMSSDFHAVSQNPWATQRYMWFLKEFSAADTINICKSLHSIHEKGLMLPCVSAVAMYLGSSGYLFTPKVFFPRVFGL